MSEQTYYRTPLILPFSSRMQEYARVMNMKAFIKSYEAPQYLRASCKYRKNQL